MFRGLTMAAALSLAVAVADASAQQPPPAAAPPAGQTPPAARRPAQKPPAKAASARISVRSHDGASLSDVRIALTGDSTGEYTTGAAGTAVLPNLKPGTYRVRCELEGYVTLEREFTLRSGTGTWNPVDIVLNEAPKPPEPVKPEPEEPAAVAAPGGPPLTMSIPDYLDKNLIGGREPIKESILACSPMETVRLLQLRENVAAHVHERVDEVLYVVAGEGAVRIGDQPTVIRAGSLVVVPNGNSHALERRGKTPLILVSTLSGSPCEVPKATR
jgi:hypothetical protein